MASDSVLAPLTSIEEINKDWIEKVLSWKMKLPVSVDSLETKIPELKAGFLSDICFVQVKFKVDDSASELALVVKVLPQHEQIVAFMKMGNLGRREVLFYMRAGSEEFLNFCRLSGLDHPVPDIYWSCLKDDAVTIVLGDLNSKSYRMCLLPDGNNLKQIKCALDAIAVIHAYGIVAIKRHGREYFHVPFDSTYLDEIYCQGVQMLLDIFGESPLAETFTSLISLHKQVINTSHRHPLIETIVHGDLWAGNVMFSANDEVASIFDWQFASIDNPLCDVTSMLLMSAEPSVYEEHLIHVLESYWKSFVNALNKNNIEVPIKFEELLSNLEKLWMHGFMFLTASLPDMMANGKITESRVRRVMNFLEKLEVFPAFLKLHDKQ